MFIVKHSEDVVEKIIDHCISGSVWQKSFTQNTLSLTEELLIKVSTVYRSHFVIVIFRESCVFRHTLPSHLLGPCFLVSQKCYLLIVFAPWRWDCWSVYPSSTWQKAINFWFNGKIFSLLITFIQLQFSVKVPNCKILVSATFCKV